MLVRSNGGGASSDGKGVVCCAAGGGLSSGGKGARKLALWASRALCVTVRSNAGGASSDGRASSASQQEEDRVAAAMAPRCVRWVRVAVTATRMEGRTVSSAGAAVRMDYDWRAHSVWFSQSGGMIGSGEGGSSCTTDHQGGAGNFL